MAFGSGVESRIDLANEFRAELLLHIYRHDVSVASANKQVPVVMQALYAWERSMPGDKETYSDKQICLPQLIYSTDPEVWSLLKSNFLINPFRGQKYKTVRDLGNPYPSIMVHPALILGVAAWSVNHEKNLQLICQGKIAINPEEAANIVYDRAEIMTSIFILGQFLPGFRFKIYREQVYSTVEGWLQATN